MIAVEKSPDAFRTISEVADDLDLPQHVLRFWETRFTTIRPLKRGGGRRYYRPDDVDLLKGIRHLLYGQGYTIKGVQRILKQDGLRFVQALGRGEQAGPPSTAPVPGDLDDEVGPSLVANDDLVSLMDARVAGRSADLAGMEPAGRDVPSGQHATDQFPPEALDALRGALDELRECQRVLANLKPR